MTHYHLAQLNIGRLQAPLDSPALADFVSQLEEINALADGTPGFVWRLKTEDGDATALRPYGDDRILVNMSVWADPEALRDYVYRSPHAEVMRRRREWFERMTEASMVLWWVPAGTVPTVDEAKARLELLRTRGPGPDGFTFRQMFPPPGASSSEPTEYRDQCPAS